MTFTLTGKPQTLSRVVPLFVLLVSCLAPAAALSQLKWSWVFPKPQGNTFLSAAAAGNKTYFLGEASTIISTADNGVTWLDESPYSGTYDPLVFSDFSYHRLAFADSQRGFISGPLWLYTSSGDNSGWQLYGSHQFHAYGPIHFVTPRLGWIGKPPARTTDGGLTWSSMKGIPADDLPVVFSSVDSAFGWMVMRNCALYLTLDGGSTWWHYYTFTPASGDTSHICLDFVMTQTGRGILSGIYRVATESMRGRGFIFRTTDYGLTWHRENFLHQYSTVLNLSDSLWLLIGNDRWGEQGIAYQPSFLRSVDGGATWSGNQTPPRWLAPHTGVWNKTTGSVFAAGSYGAIYRSTDLGLTWSVISSPHRRVQDIGFWNNPDGVTVTGLAVCDERSVFRTTDEGRTWAEHQLTVDSDKGFLGCASNGREIWLVGTDYRMFRSADCAMSWEEVHLPELGLFPRPTVQEVVFADVLHGAAVVGSQFIYRATVVLNTSDGGQSWEFTTLRSGLMGRAICMPGPGTIIVGGVSFLSGSVGTGFVARSTDSGHTWNIVDLPSPVMKIHFFDRDIGICGSYGGLYRSTDGGVTWNRDSRFGEVSSVDDIYSRGDGGAVLIQQSAVYETPDRGNTWIAVGSIPTNLGGLAAARSPGGKYFVSTHHGGLLSSVEGKVTTTELLRSGELVHEISLEQSYPNPFNSTTTIEFLVPHEENVSLAVFDVLGRCLKIVYEGKAGIGSHKFQWVADQYPSGTYFYRLQVGGSILTRKLLLVKVTEEWEVV